MAYSNTQKGESPYLKSPADQYTMSDNYHQPAMGGTGPEPLVRVDNFSLQSTGRRNTGWGDSLPKRST
jgi:hypothetical protein